MWSRIHQGSDSAGHPPIIHQLLSSSPTTRNERPHNSNHHTAQKLLQRLPAVLDKLLLRERTRKIRTALLPDPVIRRNVQRPPGIPHRLGPASPSPAKPRHRRRSPNTSTNPTDAQDECKQSARSQRNNEPPISSPRSRTRENCRRSFCATPHRAITLPSLEPAGPRPQPGNEVHPRQPLTDNHRVPLTPPAPGAHGRAVTTPPPSSSADSPNQHRGSPFTTCTPG